MTASWSDLLDKAVTEPGIISEAYSRFHNYSVGNQMLAVWQLTAREIPLGPIGTFMHWKTLGRNVKKGEKAIELCMPVTCKNAEEEVFTRFIHKRHWFALAQTEGAEYVAPAIPEWDEERALRVLDITRAPFTETNGNIQGYAIGRRVTVSPVAALPFKTLFHEIAHVLLGHTAEMLADGDERTPRDIREVEAESVALICCSSLGLPGAEFSRGYIQHWSAGRGIDEKSAARVFKVADEILRAGREVRHGG